MIILFLLNLLSTMYMTGLIWFVQIVHYPLHGEVGENSFQRYQEIHMRRTSWVVIPPMLMELLTSVALWYFSPFGLFSEMFLGLLLCLVLIWLSTGFIQAPTHGILVHRFSKKLHNRLVVSNWIRTVLWSVRSLILLFILNQLLSDLA